jgi:hypothetical protein
MIENTQGIEGADLPWHFSLLGFDIPKDYYFYPLVDHYNLHDESWYENMREQASRARVLVFYDLLHTGDREHDRYLETIREFPHSNKVYLTVNQQNFELDKVKVIRWDFMWNRFKAYYTESLPYCVNLHHCTRGAYHLHDLESHTRRNKMFLSPMGRDYGMRSQLYNIVKEYNGYVSNRSLGITFEDHPVTGIFNPIPDRFYLDSYFSIYVESNAENSNLIHLTEKTFEPLVKGHFILPFTNPGSIQRIRDLGFKLPDFIDYTYDSVIDASDRFAMVIDEFKRLLTLDMHSNYEKNIEMLEYNKACVRLLPYDNRIQELKNV